MIWLAALITILVFTNPLHAGILYQTDFETAVVPLDPARDGFFSSTDISWSGAPAKWALSRNPANVGLPFNPPPGTVERPQPDECFFTTEQAHSGTKSLKINYSVSNPEFPGNPSTYSECRFCLGNDCELPSLGNGIPDLTEFWFRAWVRPHNYGGNLQGGGNKLIYFKTSGGIGTPNALLQVFTNTGINPGIDLQNPVDCGSPTDPGASCEPAFCNPAQAGSNTSFVANCYAGWGASNNQIPPVSEMTQDAWHCIEGHYKMNTITGGVANADALFETWLDGVLVTRYSNLRFRPATTYPTTGASPDVRWRTFSIYRQGALLGSVMYWDDIAIGDSRVGCDVTPPTPQPRVGVIRFDHWPSHRPDGSLESDAGVRQLDPAQWHYRVPFFGSETGANSVTMNEGTQTVIDQELAYSVAAGIKWWCFDHAITRQRDGITYYLSSTSPNKPLVKICTQEGGLFQERIDDTITIMNAERANWLYVAGRPVIFLQTWFFDGVSFGVTPGDVTNFRNAIVANGFLTPYLVCQNFTAAAAAADKATYGCDAISSYQPLAPGGQGVSFSNLMTSAVSQWDSFATTGLKVIPFLTSGADSRPRDGSGVNWVQYATPAEIGAHMQQAIVWSAAHSNETSEHSLIQWYAWNEIAEGGWLLPSNPAINSVGNGRLDAISVILNPTFSTPSAPSNLRCNICN